MSRRSNDTQCHAMLIVAGIKPYSCLAWLIASALAQLAVARGRSPPRHGSLRSIMPEMPPACQLSSQV